MSAVAEPVADASCPQCQRWHWQCRCPDAPARPVWDILPIDRPPDRKWAFRNWVPIGCVTMLVGPGGAGKGIAALQLATSVASGNKLPFGGPDTPDIFPGSAPVLALDGKNWAGIVSTEDDMDEIARRLWRLPDIGGETARDAVEERLIVHRPEMPFWGESGVTHDSGNVFGPKPVRLAYRRAGLAGDAFQNLENFIVLRRIWAPRSLAVVVGEPGSAKFDCVPGERLAVRLAFVGHLAEMIGDLVGRGVRPVDALGYTPFAELGPCVAVGFQRVS